MNNINGDTYYINKVLGGETSCYTYLVDKYSKQVYSFIFKIVHSREDAEDISQEVFIKVFNSLGKFKGESSFSTWVYRIAYNTTISDIRKKKNKDYLFIDESQEINITEEDVEATFGESASEERMQSLDDALLKLPPDERSLITLFYTKDKSIKDVEEITGLSASNIKTKLHRIRKKIYYILSNKDINV